MAINRSTEVARLRLAALTCGAEEARMRWPEGGGVQQAALRRCLR